MYRFSFVLLCISWQFSKDDLTEAFLRYRFGGLIFGGAFVRNFTVLQCIYTQILEVRLSKFR